MNFHLFACKDALIKSLEIGKTLQLLVCMFVPQTTQLHATLTEGGVSIFRKYTILNSHMQQNPSET